MENSLALQELFPALRSIYEDIYHLIDSFEKRYSVCITRFCLGSSFCGRLFNSTVRQQFDFVNAYCRSFGLNVCLTIPVFTQSDLAQGKKTITDILDRYKFIIDEVTVNDYGMYQWIRHNYSGKLFAGRLMNKTNRDPRYTEYGKAPVTIPSLPIQVSGIELDACSSKMVIENSNNNIITCVYTPYSYISTGKICSYASLNSDVLHKFTPVSSCPINCGKYYVLHEHQSTIKFYHIGNTIYYPTDYPNIYGASQLRAIWFPLDLWEAKK